MNQHKTIEIDVPWLGETGQFSDIVISSRIRLARNIKENIFPHRANKQELYNVLEKIKKIYSKSDFLKNFYFLELDSIDINDKLFLMEKYIISPMQVEKCEGRAVLFDNKCSVSIMVNEEDHIRLQIIKSGYSLRKAWQIINKIDNIFDKNIEYAFSKEYGYLTSCMTNIGTGMRASVMIHLGSLSFENKLKDIFNSISKLGFTIRGIYGEGSEPCGDFFQISNKLSYGFNEKEIISNIEEITMKLIGEETNTRANLKMNSKFIDNVWRSYGILKTTRDIAVTEAINLLSTLRLGILLNIIPKLNFEQINKLLWAIQPGHLNSIKGFDYKNENILRAEFIRNCLSN